jgi:hypothetical protein
MPRLIANEEPRANLNAAVEKPPEQRAAEYLERCAKYVPAEILSLYLLARGVGTEWPAGVQFVLYGVFVVLTAVYFWRNGGQVPNRGRQVGVVTLSFVAWSYGIGGPFFFKALEQLFNHPVEYKGLGAVVAGVWSLTAAWIFDPRQKP